MLQSICRPRNGPGFYLAARPKLLNHAKELWDLKGFLQHFDFPSVDVAVKDYTYTYRMYSI